MRIALVSVSLAAALAAAVGCKTSSKNPAPPSGAASASGGSCPTSLYLNPGPVDASTLTISNLTVTGKKLGSGYQQPEVDGNASLGTDYIKWSFCPTNGGSCVTGTALRFPFHVPTLPANTDFSFQASACTDFPLHSSTPCGPKVGSGAGLALDGGTSSSNPVYYHQPANSDVSLQASMRYDYQLDQRINSNAVAAYNTCQAYVQSGGNDSEAGQALATSCRKVLDMGPSLYTALMMTSYQDTVLRTAVSMQQPGGESGANLALDDSTSSCPTMSNVPDTSSVIDPSSFFGNLDTSTDTSMTASLDTSGDTSTDTTASGDTGSSSSVGMGTDTTVASAGTDSSSSATTTSGSSGTSKIAQGVFGLSVIAVGGVVASAGALAGILSIPDSAASLGKPGQWAIKARDYLRWGYDDRVIARNLDTELASEKSDADKVKELQKSYNQKIRSVAISVGADKEVLKKIESAKGAVDPNTLFSDKTKQDALTDALTKELKKNELYYALTESGISRGPVTDAGAAINAYQKAANDFPQKLTAKSKIKSSIDSIRGTKGGLIAAAGILGGGVLAILGTVIATKPSNSANLAGDPTDPKATLQRQNTLGQQIYEDLQTSDKLQQQIVNHL